MGLLDSVAGALVGKMLGGDNGNMANIAMEMFNQNGGLAGILEKFQANGLGEQAASWVGKGENLSVSPDQITNVLGNSAIGDLAAKFGITPDMLSSQIATYLPTVIDKMTPDGEVSDKSGDLLGNILGMLK
jgi:uncharacterized protein YidB (DUF937 family)